MDSFCMPVTVLHHQKKKVSISTWFWWDCQGLGDLQKAAIASEQQTAATEVNTENNFNILSCSQLPRCHRCAESKAYELVLGNNRILQVAMTRFLSQQASKHLKIPEKIINILSLAAISYCFSTISLNTIDFYRAPEVKHTNHSKDCISYI